LLFLFNNLDEIHLVLKYCSDHLFNIPNNYTIHFPDDNKKHLFVGLLKASCGDYFNKLKFTDNFNFWFNSQYLNLFKCDFIKLLIDFYDVHNFDSIFNDVIGQRTQPYKFAHFNNSSFDIYIDYEQVDYNNTNIIPTISQNTNTVSTIIQKANEMEMIKNQNEMIKNQNELIKNQNKVIKNQNEKKIRKNELKLMPMIEKINTIPTENDILKEKLLLKYEITNNSEDYVESKKLFNYVTIDCKLNYSAVKIGRILSNIINTKKRDINLKNVKYRLGIREKLIDVNN
jgi:hypothetical protein